MRSALEWEVVAKQGMARAGKLVLKHGEVLTPVFMPVGTLASIKGLTSQQVENIGYRLILGNTYHLALRPGADVIEGLGGIHEFMDWKHNVLTDSGGFQMVSLVALSKVSEEGVEFKSPVDGTDMLLTPEKSINLQNQIGSDIIMALDDVISSTTTGDRVAEASKRTIRWIDRCISAHRNPHRQNLFGIVQGGLDPDLRAQCLKDMIARDEFLPGYAIGGLAGGEDKNYFWRVVHQCTSALPSHKPRYLMGVGYPLDLVVCSLLGVDMFDCVYPCRTARFGTALVPTGIMKLKASQYAQDYSPILEGCRCLTCQNYTRAFLQSIVGKESVACQLITIHNLTYVFDLMTSLRNSIIEGSADIFVRCFLKTMFPTGEIPQWVRDAMAAINISLSES